MTPETEQDLAHTLLVELLAYQFASPVRWIETQDYMLGKCETQRIVEIGPADTLATMARRTVALKYEHCDRAQSIRRQVLSYKSDADEIYYSHDHLLGKGKDGHASQTDHKATTEPRPMAIDIAGSIPSGPPPDTREINVQKSVQSTVADVPPEAGEIVCAIVARKLKKSPLDLSMGKSIKEMVGGRGKCTSSK
jgi:fatty acid synthase subunit alpha, fungi type